MIRRGKTRDVDYEDVADIIGVASEMQAVAAERLSVEELEEVGRELDIPEHYVRPAIEELRRRRAAQLAAEAKRARTRRTILITAGSVVGIFGLWILIAGQSLRGTLLEVDRQRAQVINVVERQEATRAQWAEAPDSDHRQAELSGAENRVRIERQRYDAAATAYNTQAGGFPANIWRAITGLPDTVPLSHQVGEW